MARREDQPPAPTPLADLAGAETVPLDPSGEARGEARGAGAAAPLFAEGDKIAERYLVVRFVAQGGMGQVYEVRDFELGGDTVALKTLHQDLRDAESVAQFKRELQLARRVTHPNVCRLFDVGYHERPDGRQVPFSTMELLAGKTLAEHLRATGALGAAEALALVRPMVAGLAAAHEAGVVHRDFKAENVVIVTGPSATRVVVSDFGMAALAREARGGRASGSGNIVGSPSTISPEQLEGGTVDRHADVYALGVVLFQLRTGGLPFTGPTPLAAAMARLGQPAPRAGVGEPWDSVIARCLERDPARRFDSVGEVLAALEPPATRPATRPAPARPPRRRTAAILLAAAMALGGGVAWWAASSGGRSTQPSAAAPAARASLALVGFAEPSGKAELVWLGTALAEMTAAELAAGGRLRVVPADTVARVRVDLGLPAGSVPGAARERTRTALGADYFVGGSYFAAGGRVRLDVTLVDARSGETVDAVSVEGAEDALPELATEVGARLRTRLGVGQAPGSRERVAVSMPRDPQAARAYAEGLARLRVFDLPGARAQLEAAVAREPGHALTWMALAETYTRLGANELAAHAANEAWGHAEGLPREDRLAVEALHAAQNNQAERAAELYGALYRFFPDDLEHGLRYVTALAGAKRTDKALATLDELRRLPAPAAEDPRIDLAEAATAAVMVDFARARVAAGRAAEHARAQGARQLLAEARRLEGWAHRNLGELDQAEAAAGEARALFAQAGHAGGEAACLETLGDVYAKRGQLGRLEQAAAERARIWRGLGNPRAELMARLSSAGARALRGDIDGGRRDTEAVVAEFRALGIAYGLGVALVQLAGIEKSAGRLDEAWAHVLEADEVFQRESRRMRAFVDTVAGDVALARGDLGTARARLERALEVREALKLASAAAQTRVVLARLGLAEGRLEEAASLARAALAELSAQRAVDDEAEAAAVLARVLARQGRKDEARALLASARERSAGSENLETKKELAEAEADVGR